MKRALSVFVFLFVALAVAAPPAPAFQGTTNARYYDVQRLQDDLYVLEDSLARSRPAIRATGSSRTARMRCARNSSA